jgi:predicted DNA-binding transcriptional regulator AlpA
VSRSVLPNWPAMLRRNDAAAYCSLSAAEFERQVSSGALPPPVALGRAELWSRMKLDKALSVIAGDDLPDWRAGSPLYDGGGR